ncbi:hypothetical protein CBM2588_A50007 [Cupriavidus taiwanensis]|nr:hypothetical protein CBM2588_A50007 [Cupriavidus taiwanensis]SOZ81818.1 hypothetical protein CBM2618_A50365 [Cupriavidus taiwanensis]
MRKKQAGPFIVGGPALQPAGAIECGVCPQQRGRALWTACGQIREKMRKPLKTNQFSDNAEKMCKRSRNARRGRCVQPCKVGAQDEALGVSDKRATGHVAR